MRSIILISLAVINNIVLYTASPSSFYFFFQLEPVSYKTEGLHLMAGLKFKQNCIPKKIEISPCLFVYLFIAFNHT